MGFEFETGGEQVAQFSRTAVNFKDAAALAAGEMVVVGFTGEFIASGFAREFDGGEPSFIDK